jgi:alkylation response protein AidB-like acyl-CoA dehydrogenase
VEQLRSLVWWAAWAADQAPDELPLASAAAKGAAAVTLEQAADTLVHVHGGVGFTWEHDAHLYWRRAAVDRLLVGDDVGAFDEVARLAVSGAGAVPEVPADAAGTPADLAGQGVAP